MSFYKLLMIDVSASKKIKFCEEVSSSDKNIASIQSEVSNAATEMSPEASASEHSKKKRKKSKRAEESHSSMESEEVSASVVIASKLSKKKGVPALKDKNSGVLKVIEVCKLKRPAFDSHALEPCEPAIGDGIGVDW